MPAAAVREGVYLDGRYVRGQAQSFVIPVCHDEASHQARAHTPTALMHVLLLAIAV